MKKKIIMAFLLFTMATATVESTVQASSMKQTKSMSVSLQALPPEYVESSWDPYVIEDAETLNTTTDEEKRNEIIDDYINNYDQKKINLLKEHITSGSVLKEIERRQKEREENMSDKEREVVLDARALDSLTDENSIRIVLTPYYGPNATKEAYQSFLYSNTASDATRKILNQYEDAEWERTSALDYDPNVIEVDFKSDVSMDQIKEIVYPFHMTIAFSVEDETNHVTKTLLRLNERFDLTTKRALSLFSGFDEVKSLHWYRHTMIWANEAIPDEKQIDDAKKLDTLTVDSEANYDVIKEILEPYFGDDYQKENVLKLKKAVSAKASLEKIANWEAAYTETNSVGFMRDGLIFITFKEGVTKEEAQQLLSDHHLYGPSVSSSESIVSLPVFAREDLSREKTAELLRGFDQVDSVSLEMLCGPKVIEPCTITDNAEEELNANHSLAIAARNLDKTTNEKEMRAILDGYFEKDSYDENKIAQLKELVSSEQAKNKIKDYEDAKYEREHASGYNPEMILLTFYNDVPPERIREVIRSYDMEPYIEQHKCIDCEDPYSLSFTGAKLRLDQTTQSAIQLYDDCDDVAKAEQLVDGWVAPHPWIRPSRPSSDTSEPSGETSVPSDSSVPSEEPSSSSETVIPSEEPSSPSESSIPIREPSTLPNVSVPSREPSKPSEESSRPSEPSKPSEESVPSREPSKPSEESSRPSEPSKPSEESVPSREPSKPSEGSLPSEPSKPTEVSVPSKEPSKPSEESSRPSEPSKPSEESVPSREPSKPSEGSLPSEPSKPTEVSVPSKEPSKPFEESSRPSEPSKPSEESVPSREPSKPSEESSRPSEPSKPSEVSIPSREPSKPSEESSRPSEPSKPSEGSVPSIMPSEPSDSGSIASRPAIPNQVKKVTAYKIKKTEANISWKKVTNADGYKIYVKQGTEDYTLAATVTSAKKTSSILKKLDASSNYKIMIRAYRKTTEGIIYGKASQTVSLNMKKQLISSDLKVVDQLKLARGKSKQLKLTVPKNKDKSYIRSITYKVKNMKICSVKNGNLKAKKLGKTTVSTIVTLKNGQKKTFRTTVQVTK